MGKMKGLFRIWLAGLALSLSCGGVRSQVVATGTPPVVAILGGTVGSVPPAGANTVMIGALNGANVTQLKTDGSANLDVNCIVGCAGGSASNASSAVATSSTNGQTVAWLYLFNGTTWDQAQADASKNLKVNVNAALPTGANTIGAVTQASGPWTQNITQFGGTNLSTGTGTGGAGMPRVTVSSDSSLTANAGTNLNTSALALETGGNLATLAGSITSSVQQSNEKQINGVAPLMGNGIAGTGSQRVTIASDNTAFSVNANAGTNLNTSLLALESGGNLATLAGAITASVEQANVKQINGIAPLMGNGVTGTGSQRVTIASDNTAFSVNAAQSGVWTVQPGNTANTTAWKVDASATAIQGAAPGASVASGNTISVQNPSLDPCQTQAHAIKPINIVTAANTTIVTGTAAKKTYVCYLFLYASAAENVAIIEGSGTNCATSPLGLAGGNTAATGFLLVANQGLPFGTGANAVMASTVNANDVCLITSSTAQLSGVVVTAVQ
jgi:hypothetical protein